MITLQALVLLTLTAVVAAITAALTLASGGTWPAALLAAGSAAGATLAILPRLIARDDTPPQDRPRRPPHDI